VPELSHNARMVKEAAKRNVENLVEKFRQAEQAETLKRLSEEDTKKNFIMPLFRALGWDVDGREVSAEENIVGKRVDYGFYIDGHIQFYLEAKAAKEDTEQEKFANQAISYSWNKGTTWAVLTNFKLLEIFNAEDATAPISAKRFKSISWEEYVERFDELWLLSREACGQKLLDTEAEKVGKKLKRVSVTAKLVEDLNDARDLLSRMFVAWNPKLASDPVLLDEGVQRVLDRIIFIRVAEDRGIEDPTLQPLVRAWEADWEAGRRDKLLYQAMEEKFRELDGIYNSNIFAPHASDSWEERKNIVRDIIEKFYGKYGYYTYDFKAIPADILGTVYEQYLGHKLSQAETRNLLGEANVSVAKDARKRKEQGIYYTPRFIVDYIVEQALGPVLAKCDSIADLQKIKVLDPACGSGSFLIKALELIYKRYQELGSAGQYVKLQILTNNLYGVDLDEQAVEIARLNLLLAALEERMKMPNLDHFKNGNSLISGTDEELEKRFGKDWRDKKPFNWEKEFPDVFDQGGFDVIIGNPPYIKEFVNKSAFDGLHDSPYYQGKMDLWTLFACISIDLLKDGGVMSFIAPNNWVSNAGASIFRDKILADGQLRMFVDFGDYKVFEQAGIQTMIYVFEKEKPKPKYSVEYLRIADKNISEEKLAVAISKEKQKIEIEPAKLIGKNIVFSGAESSSIFDKLESKRNFELTDKEVGQGIVAAPDKYFLENDLTNYSEREREFLKPFFTSAGKYKGGESENHIFYISEKNFGDKKLTEYPNIKKHFEPFKKQLTEAKEKYETPEKPYFYLHRERNEDFFKSGPKIVCGVRVAFPSFFYTEKVYYGSRALNFIKTDRVNLKYLTAILNSKLTFFWLKNKGKQLGDLLQVDKGPLLEIPIRVGGKGQQKPIIALVDKMLDLNKKLAEETKDSEKWKKIKTDIERTDKEIDEEVYRLYGLNDEEIKTIERS
jgi:adenine-specific DNA-methyltransferase